MAGFLGLSELSLFGAIAGAAGLKRADELHDEVDRLEKEIAREVSFNATRAQAVSFTCRPCGQTLPLEKGVYDSANRLLCKTCFAAGPEKKRHRRSSEIPLDQATSALRSLSAMAEGVIKDGDWPPFLVPPFGFIQHVDPYDILGIPEDTPQAEITSQFPHPDARLDPNSVDREAEAILSDPARRFAWHLLRCPKKRPGVRSFLHAGRDFSAQRAVAAYLADQAVRREVWGLHDESLDELWSEVDLAFKTLASRDDVEAEARLLAERLKMSEPHGLARMARQWLREFVPSLHAILFVMSTTRDWQMFHWSKIPEAMTELPVVKACVRHWKRRKLAPTMELIHEVWTTAEQGQFELALHKYWWIAIGMERSLPISLGIDLSTIREQRRLAYLVGQQLMRMRQKLASLPEPRASATLSHLLSLGETTAFDSCLLSVMGTLHARLAQCAASRQDLRRAADHLLRAGLCDPDSPFSAELGDDGVLHLAAAGLTFSIASPHAPRLLEILDRESAALAKPGMYHPATSDRQRRERAEQIDLVIRLDLALPTEAALTAATLLVTELAKGRAFGQAFSITRCFIQGGCPDLVHLPWEHIEAAMAGDAPLTAASLASALPAPPPPFGNEDPDVELTHRAARRLAAYATHVRVKSRAAPSTFLYPWLFSRRWALSKLVAAAGVLLLLAGVGRVSAEAWQGYRRDTAYRDLCAAASVKDMAAVGEAARAFLAMTPPDVFDHRTLDVLELHSGALLREISRAAREHRQADLERITAEAVGIEARASAEEQTWRRIEEAQ